jgi:hypothetical protein
MAISIPSPFFKGEGENIATKLIPSPFLRERVKT